ncbi:CbrC family protein [Streptomyces kunmingensis]|uniref:CbrC family protein n=2 Tax=Streptomyces kunmingensis TaxID=68225 RepID=A0ABU6C1X9_9ACTN|nr:CbrC family protein [Streptomyces kunmingensis]MEB3958720.1 CbrC family protein [Streptomyces kunmingensis]
MDTGLFWQLIERARATDTPLGPVATGAISAGSETCACRGQAQGWIYTAGFSTAHDVVGCLYLWCIADGTATARFESEFTGSYGLGHTLRSSVTGRHSASRSTTSRQARRACCGW